MLHVYIRRVYGGELTVFQYKLFPQMQKDNFLA
jgi:hypothetical protein